MPWGYLLRILGPVAIVAAFWLHGCSVGVARQQRAQLSEQVERLEAARETERLQNRSIAANKEKSDAQFRHINARLADALERLRNRPERLPEPARAACQGATGAELSGPDGGFLEREAARADRLRAALAECYGWIDAVRQAPR